MPAEPSHRPDRATGPQSVEWVPLPTVVDTRGEKVVTLHDERGRPHTRRLAELILETFIGPCPPGHEVRFKDGNRLNSSLDNLEWASAVPPGKVPVSGPAAVRPVRLDGDGRIIAEGGELVIIPGLDRDQVLGGLADAAAGRVRPIGEILTRRPG